MVSIAAFQAVDLGSIPGQRKVFELCNHFLCRKIDPVGNSAASFYGRSFAKAQRSS